MWEITAGTTNFQLTNPSFRDGRYFMFHIEYAFLSDVNTYNTKRVNLITMYFKSPIKYFIDFKYAALFKGISKNHAINF